MNTSIHVILTHQRNQCTFYEWISPEIQLSLFPYLKRLATSPFITILLNDKQNFSWSFFHVTITPFLWQKSELKRNWLHMIWLVWRHRQQDMTAGQKKEENRYWKPKKSWYYNSMTGFWGNDKSSMMHHKWVVTKYKTP